MVNDVVKIPTPIINYQYRLFWKHQRKENIDTDRSIILDQDNENAK